MIDLALQENRFFIDTQKSSDRSPAAFSPEERKALGVFTFQEKGPPQNLRGNNRPLSATAPKLDLDH
jgi:hypothetical protein